VAEALAQMPGVTLDRSIPGTQRVSIDGMDPSLNLSLLDGHPVAQAIWLFGDSPNRGFNYSLLPPEILGQLEVYKSPKRACRKAASAAPCSCTRSAAGCAVQHAERFVRRQLQRHGRQRRPNGSVFYSWHNDDKTFGVDVSAQHYEQFTSREGQENYGYQRSLGQHRRAGRGNMAIQNELNAGTIKAPTRSRTRSAPRTSSRPKSATASVNLQWKPNENFESTLGLMYMRDNLDNLNQSMYPWATNSPGGITSLTEGPNGIITSGTQVGTPASTPPIASARRDTFTDNYARSRWSPPRASTGREVQR
jgi:iron complex outermembrane receptor protein